MKILLISNMYPSREFPFYGIFVKNFENQLVSEGFTINKVVIAGRSSSAINKTLKYLKFSADIFKKIVKDDYDLIYVHYAEHSLLPLVLLRKFIRKPLVINAHGDDILYPSVISSIVTTTIKHSDLLVVPSDYFREIGRNKYNHRNIFVSPSGGVDMNLFKPAKNGNGKGHSIFTIGYVSRIDPGKGWDILLDAAHFLKQKNLSFRVMMIGSGEESKMLVSKIQELGLSDTVDYLGAKPHEELPNYFNRMDIFVFPSKGESLGLVGLEAMACGVPVVGSNIGGLPSYIRSGINGKLFAPGNARELAEKIEYFIITDKEIVKKYTDEALETANRYDSIIVAKKMAEKLRELIEKNFFS